MYLQPGGGTSFTRASLFPYRVMSSGEQQVLRTTSDKARYTIMLAVTAAREKLPAYVLFRLKKATKISRRPRNVRVGAAPTGMMSRQNIKDWLTLTVDTRNFFGAKKRSALIPIRDS